MEPLISVSAPQTPQLEPLPVPAVPQEMSIAARKSATNVGKILVFERIMNILIQLSSVPRAVHHYLHRTFSELIKKFLPNTLNLSIYGYDPMVEQIEEKAKMRNFTHINEEFTCENCGETVPPRKTSCRNHCPFCLTSKHVDVNPGDRANPCKGIMDAIGYENNAKGLVLHFRCRICQGEGRNVSAHEDSETPDDYDKILSLKSGVPSK
jgi:hypothetical protein